MTRMHQIRRELKFFFNFSNLQFQWTMMTFASLLLLLIVTLSNLPFLASLAIGLFLMVMTYQFGRAAIFMPVDEPYFVKLFQNTKSAIRYATVPGNFDHAKQQIIRPITIDFAEVYSVDGTLRGHTQDVWSNDNWHFTPVKEGNVRRMPRIAYWRTKKS
jgi:hypothetical protein